MTKSLPLFFYPTTWLWLDDDKHLLHIMATVFKDDNTVKPFHSARECLGYLKNYQLPFDKQAFLTSKKETEDYGTLHHTPTDLDVTKIIALAQDKTKSDEISVMVVDYSMPEMSGFEFAEQIKHLPIQKILLTGEAQPTDAVCGFNQNLIQRYLQKGSESMADKLDQYLKELTWQYFKLKSEPLLAHLEIEGLLPLSDPAFIDFFRGKMAEHHIEEYYLLDKQGSLFCIDEQQNEFCLAIITENDLKRWLEMYGQDSQLSESQLNQINQGKLIPFFGPGKETWQAPIEEWQHHLYPATLLKGRENYYWVFLNNFRR